MLQWTQQEVPRDWVLRMYIIYRRSEAEMPAREEVHHAKEEGIIFKVLTNPVQIIGDDNGWVKGMECVSMELGEQTSLDVVVL